MRGWRWLEWVAVAAWLLVDSPGWAAGGCEQGRESAARWDSLPVVQAPEPRVALVVGNAAYQSLPPTRNAVNDASDMAAVLSRLGFEVICATDVTQGEFQARLETFHERLRRAGPEAVGLFFYAGHGAQIQNLNYLVPVDAQAMVAPQITGGDRGLARVDVGVATAGVGNLIALDGVLQRIIDAGNRNGSNLIFLDACCDNPWNTPGWGKPKASFNIRGLYWAFGTGYGKTASDGAGRNGVFTQALLQKMALPGATVDQLMKQVTAAVDHETGQQQTPETGGSLVRDFQLIPGQDIVVHTTYEALPLWTRLIYAVLTLASLGLGTGYYRYRRRLAWTSGIDLRDKLAISASLLEEVRRKSRLATADIVGYVKEVRAGKLLALITMNHDLTLGRDSEVNLVIPRETVSGQHARLGWDKAQGGFWIEDLHSSNGTWWDYRERLKAGRRYPLESGRVFHLADEKTPLVVIAHQDKVDRA